MVAIWVDDKIIQRISSGFLDLVVLCDLVLLDDPTVIRGVDGDEQIANAEDSLKLGKVKSLNHMPDEAAAVLASNGLIEYDYLVIVTVVGEVHDHKLLVPLIDQERLDTPSCQLRQTAGIGTIVQGKIKSRAVVNIALDAAIDDLSCIVDHHLNDFISILGKVIFDQSDFGESADP
jgi:hypothetical protein